MKKNILIYIITGLLLISFGFIYVSQQVNINALEEEKVTTNAEKAEENAKSEKIRGEIENSGTKEAIEEEARKKLGLMYPWEIKYVDSNG